MVYLELLFLLNMWIDFLLLVTTNLILKSNSSYKRILLASLVGGLSTFLVFLPNDFLLILLKIIFAVIMEYIVNKYHGLKTLLENVLYFYLVSIILAGTLYLLSIDNMPLISYYLLLCLITPIILFIYQKQIKKLNNYYKDRYDVTLFYEGKKYSFNGYLDTGNKLYDQYKRRPICLLYTNKIHFDYDKGILVPIETANGKSLLKCIKVDKMIIDNKMIKNALIGLSTKKINIQDINMILHNDIL